MPHSATRRVRSVSTRRITCPRWAPLAVAAALAALRAAPALALTYPDVRVTRAGDETRRDRTALAVRLRQGPEGWRVAAVDVLRNEAIDVAAERFAAEGATAMP